LETGMIGQVLYLEAEAQGRRAGRILRAKDHEVLTMKCNEKAEFSELSAIFTPPSKNAHD
jgi:hypothetical protein